MNATTEIDGLPSGSARVPAGAEVVGSPDPDTAPAGLPDAHAAGMAAAFAASQHPDCIVLLDLPAPQADNALPGARAAAICVPESCIEHALRLDGCTLGLRRASSKLPVTY